MNSKKSVLVCLLALTLISPFSFIHAQSGSTGAIAGSVVDAKGSPVSNAQIEISPAGISVMRVVRSDAGGNFTAASLPVGSYDVVVKAGGFATSKYSDIVVRLTETTRFNPSLVTLGTEAAGDGSPQSEKIVVVVLALAVDVDAHVSAAQLRRRIQIRNGARRERQ